MVKSACSNKTYTCLSVCSGFKRGRKGFGEEDGAQLGEMRCDIAEESKLYQERDKDPSNF